MGTSGGTLISISGPCWVSRKSLRLAVLTDWTVATVSRGEVLNPPVGCVGVLTAGALVPAVGRESTLHPSRAIKKYGTANKTNRLRKGMITQYETPLGLSITGFQRRFKVHSGCALE